MDYRLLDHTADVAIEAKAGTIEGVFAAIADGLAAAQCDSIPEIGDRFEIEVAAESREALLFDYLDELIYQRDVRGVLPVNNEVCLEESNGGVRAAATFRGVPVEHIEAREVKAVTYSEMVLEQVDDQWRAYVVFDV